MFRPEPLDIIEDAHGLSIRLPWYKPKALFLAFFCLVWCGFLVFWYTMASVGGAPLLFFIFPLLHVAVGVGLSYYTLCLFFNKTYIDVNDQHLWIHHTPIPWWKGNADLAVADIEQAFVKEKVSKGKNGTSYTYTLMAKLHNGTTRKLIDIGLSDSDQALVIEELIENYLGISDQPVKGAYGRVRKSRPRQTSPPAALPATDPKAADELELRPSDKLDLKEIRKEKLPEWDEGDLV